MPRIVVIPKYALKDEKKTVSRPTLKKNQSPDSAMCRLRGDLI